MDPVSAVALLSPYTKQIWCLCFVSSLWRDIRRFLEFNSGPLPPLRTLRIDYIIDKITPDTPDAITLPSPPLFSNAVNLQEFRLDSESLPFLDHFAFPSLTSFELSMVSAEDFRASQLLDFLEASPMLPVVHMKILMDISFEGVPRERIAVLHNVESLCLVMSDGEPGYKLAAHISCPSATHTSLTCTYKKDFNRMPPQQIFTAFVPWNAIVRQYTRGSIEEIALEIEIASCYFVLCSLTFRSPDATIIELRFEVTMDDEDENDSWFEAEMFFAEMYQEAFCQASRTIQDLPLLANVKRLRMCHGGPILDYA